MIKFYNDLLKSVGSSVGPEGNILLEDGSPMKIGKLEVYLPTRSNVKNTTAVNGNSIVKTKELFTPLRENATKLMSPSLEAFKRELELQLYMDISYVAMGVATYLSASELADDKMNPMKLALLEAITVNGKMTPVDKKTVDNLSKLLNKMSSIGHVSLIKINIKRGGTINGIKYRRVAGMEFPLYDLLCDGDTVIHGVKLRKNDVKIYKDILEFILPTDELGAESNNPIAPSLEALLLARQCISDKLSNVARRFKEIIPLGVSVQEDSVLQYIEQLNEDSAEVKEIVREINGVPAHSNEMENKPMPVTHTNMPASPIRPAIEQPQQVNQQHFNGDRPQVNSNGNTSVRDLLNQQHNPQLQMQQPMHNQQQWQANNGQVPIQPQQMHPQQPWYANTNQQPQQQWQANNGQFPPQQMHPQQPWYANTNQQPQQQWQANNGQFPPQPQQPMYNQQQYNTQVQQPLNTGAYNQFYGGNNGVKGSGGRSSI